jgi:mono/diheme cytochrome c family protein
MLHNSKWGGVSLITMPVLWVALMILAGTAASAQTTRTNNDSSFEDQFWKYLVGNNYKNWSPGPGAAAGFYKGRNPHGAYLKMYVNRTAAGSMDDMAVGSVVILENYFKDQSLKTISVMYRTTGFNPDGNDWYWIEYRPDGSVVRAAAQENETQNRIRNVSLTTSPKLLMGKAANCIQCHQSAAGDDFVFSNDRADQTLAKNLATANHPVARDNSAQEIELLADENVSGEESTSEDDLSETDFVADADADSFFESR